LTAVLLRIRFSDMMLYYWENDVRMLGGPDRVIQHHIPDELNHEYGVSFQQCESSCICRQKQHIVSATRKQAFLLCS